MKRILVILCICWVVSSCSFKKFDGDQGTTVKMKAEGSPESIDAHYVKENGEIWVPLDRAAQLFHFHYDWEPESKTAIMGYTDPIYELATDVKEAKVGDDIVQLNEAPKLIDDTLYIESSSLSQLWNTPVTWDDKAAALVVTPSNDQSLMNITEDPGAGIQMLSVLQGSAQLTGSASFRTGPSTSSTVMRFFRRGEIVSVVEQTNRYWYKVTDQGGTTGYVSSHYIQVASVPQRSAQLTGSASFRTGPSTSSTVMRYFRRGEIVSVVEQTNQYWYKVTDMDGTTGYVSSHYVSVGDQPGVPGPSPAPAPAPSPAPQAPPEAASDIAGALIAYAKTFMGAPYKFAAGPYEQTHAFDCSSFVQHVFKHVGIKLPRSSRSQATVGQLVARSDLQPGDLIFFYTPGRFSSNKIVGHVGIYIGNGQVIHTYGSPGVTITDITRPSWSKRYLHARREL